MAGSSGFRNSTVHDRFFTFTVESTDCASLAKLIDGLLLLPDFPTEIIVDILARLPVKTLLRFRCVCKSWKALISDRQFAEQQFGMSAKNPNFTHHRIMVNCEIGESYSLKDFSVYSVYNELHTQALELEWSLKNAVNVDSIVGSVNGLLCLGIDETHVVVLNPSLRVHKTLSTPSWGIRRTNGFSHIVYGFGYDESISDYKAVAIFCFPHNQDNRTQVEIITLTSNSWRRIGNFPAGIPVHNSGRYVKGTLNWIALSSPFGPSKCIVSLNLEKETDCDIPIPDCGTMDFEFLSLGVLGGCLCLL